MAGGFVGAFAESFKPFDYHTENANTAIDEEVQGKAGLRLALVTMNYLCGGTAQDVNIMYASDAVVTTGGAVNTAGVVALSGQKDITTTNAPLDPAGNAAAASDIIAFQLTDGTWEFDTITGIVGSVVSMTANITGVDAGAGATAVAIGGKVRIFGVIADGSLFKLHLVLSTLYDENNTILAWHPFIGDPFYVSNPNATGASFQNSLIFAYVANK